MKIISTNICNEPRTFVWNGTEEQTGIFKFPTSEKLFLTKSDVQKDTIINRVNHGGENKACYLFSADQYPFWKEKYPNHEWNWGMFGENLTITGLDESQIRIGNVYKMGSALVQVSQPREPCYKLGIRFGTQQILKEFIDQNHPGTYVKILEEGEVSMGDELKLIQQSENTLTVQEFYELMFLKEKPKDLLQRFMDNPAVPLYKKERMQKYL
ncbi:MULTISPECIES: MOSC domain-containing protein [Maribacter]|uniref:MOSC domain-containing protein n=1 Tax=Maribacter flavus TaxID=1658664 RepID=A0A5B2TQG3_9FLAO|nr:MULTISPECIES: MOSC domain-containing protein [Maribacter]KAA2216419.1 MOSC domain-containing protein [Maribacter flavus]MDC6406672.1 MOSC domain-containing protein [Maribacter sp. PR66]MEE1973886.1 MOSC domain-containing protein [Maribacter flavus]